MKRWARDLLNRTDVLILDTETTGLGHTAELVELAIVDTTGKVLFDELVKPAVEGPAQDEVLAEAFEISFRAVG